jgi:hypothetical protein
MLPNTHAILGVVAHYIDRFGNRRHIVIGLREVLSEHSGENIAVVLIALFKEYEIAGNISYFIADNAELNNKYINAVLQALYLSMLAKQKKACCLYYFSYIVNLYA